MKLRKRAAAAVVCILTTSASNATALPDGSTATSMVVHSGAGHKLIVPYFTAQGGNATLLNLVNTDQRQGKAVKVRFRSAANADTLLDFQVLLGPADTWTGSITAGPDGRAALSTADRSCTRPAQVHGQSFSVARFPPALTISQAADHTREGYVEIINMADIPPVLPGTSASPNTLHAAVNGASGPPTCAEGVLQGLANAPATTAEANAMGLAVPTGTLFANWTIINVPRSGAATGQATALLATVESTPGRAVPATGALVFSPQTAVTLASSGSTGALAADINRLSADPALRTGTDTSLRGGTVFDALGRPYPVGSGRSLPVVEARRSDLPDLSTPYLGKEFAAGVAAPLDHAALLDNLLATFELQNEFLTDRAIAARTDWVVAMPTRRYSVAMDTRGAESAEPPLLVFNVNARFRSLAASTVQAGNTSAEGFRICVTPVGAPKYFDRDGRAPNDAGLAPPNLCGATTVLSWNASPAESVLAASVSAQEIRTNQAGGWSDGYAAFPTGNVLSLFVITGIMPNTGMPMLGTAFVRATNPQVSPGIAANFGGAWEHRYRRFSGPASHFD